MLLASLSALAAPGALAQQPDTAAADTVELRAIDVRAERTGAGLSNPLLLLTATTTASASQLNAGLENLLDKLYREHGSGIDAPGRHIWARVSWRIGP